MVTCVPRPFADHDWGICQRIRTNPLDATCPILAFRPVHARGSPALWRTGGAPARKSRVMSPAPAPAPAIPASRWGQFPC